MTTITTTTTITPSLTKLIPTPTRDATLALSSSVQYPNATATAAPTQPRLLYRGALSLPDSHLLLDGLTFTINIPSSEPHTLLETPLPLALESMRGRPSLCFTGIIKMSDVYCDFSERVNLHVHPRCILTHQLFAHTLCTAPVSPSKGHTDSGIRISLGDTSNANSSPNNDIVVFGRPHPSSSIMQLCVARIVSKPVPSPIPATEATQDKTQARPPRPDDPTPRKPPAGFAGMSRIGLGMRRTSSVKLKGKEKENSAEMAEGCARENGPSKKQKKETSLVRMGSIQSQDQTQNQTQNQNQSQGSFKIPPLPPPRGRPLGDTDVFDAPMQEDSNGDASRSMDLEGQNKIFIKRAVVRLMNAAGVTKTNPSFKEYFNTVYHGTSFALRGKIATVSFDSEPKESELLDRVAQAHITLYLGGSGVGVLLLQQ